MDQDAEPSCSQPINDIAETYSRPHNGHRHIRIILLSPSSPYQHCLESFHEKIAIFITGYIRPSEYYYP